MSTTIGKRKRARKACLPCHQRKRKCDGEYPCGMCTTYEYDCRYNSDDINGTADENDSNPLLTPAKRANITNGSRGALSQPRVTQGPDKTNESSETATGIFDVQKSRYIGSSAAMAFPHILSMTFGSDSPSNQHSFAYNFGIRPEEISNAHGQLKSLISANELDFFSGAFFSILAPIADFMDPGIYTERCRDLYDGSSCPTVAFTAVAAGVAALGSFVSSERHSRESDLVRYAKAILDDPASIRNLSIEHIIAWAMRVFYLRATTRPNNAWIASCTSMHLCETIGLHKENNIKKMVFTTNAAVVGHDVDRLRRLFWISWAGHNILSYECDRSSVRFDAVTCQAIVPRSGSIADQFVQIAQIIPTPNSPFRLEREPLNPIDQLFQRLKALNKLHFTDSFLVITKADVIFCFYRRIYQPNMGTSEEIIQLVIDNGNAAVEAAEQLADQGCLFWNAMGSVFQYACILLSIDSPVADIHVATAFKGLENLVKAADTGLTRRALSMAQHLLSLKIAKKRKQLTRLEAVEASCQSSQAQPEVEINTALLNMDWLEDWDQFLVESYSSVLGADLPL